MECNNTSHPCSLKFNKEFWSIDAWYTKLQDANPFIRYRKRDGPSRRSTGKLKWKLAAII